MLADTLGVDPESTLKTLFRTRLALAAEGWGQIDRGIVVLAAPEGRTPQQSVQLIAGPEPYPVKKEDGGVLVIRTAKGLWIAASKNAIVLSQITGEGSLFDETVSLLAGKNITPLTRSRNFVRQVAGLPAPRHGCGYWHDPTLETTTSPSTAPATAPAFEWSKFWPSLESGALGVYIRSHQVEFVIRDAARGEYVYRPRVVLDRIFSLPQSTLAAWAIALDVPEAFDAAIAAQFPSGLERWLDELRNQGDLDALREQVLGRVGPRCIAVLGCDFDSPQRLPQAALLIESVDAPQVAEALRAIIAQIAAEVGEDKIALHQSEHLGAVIHELRLRANPDPATGTLASLIAENMAPSFAAAGGWLILATSPDHVRQLIDTAGGVAPSLRDVIALEETAVQMRRAVGLALVQPAFSLGTIRYWEYLLEQRRRGARSQARLGVDIRNDAPPGQVVIASVDEGGPAAGLLMPEDVILGCNGTLLAMASPADHLRNLIFESGGGPVTLRVARSGDLIEVTVTPIGAGPAGAASELKALLDLIRPIERIAGELAIAIYSVERPPRGSGHAQLVIKFDPQAAAP